jgi:hypothetical protein
VLAHWVAQLRRGEVLAQCAAQLAALLAQRCAPPAAAAEEEEAAAAGAAHTQGAAASSSDNDCGCCSSISSGAGDVAGACGRLLAGVRSLLAAEARDVAAAAHGLLASQPEALLQPLVLQVRAAVCAGGAGAPAPAAGSLLASQRTPPTHVCCRAPPP